jgi:hypothetical protein
MRSLSEPLQSPSDAPSPTDASRGTVTAGPGAFCNAAAMPRGSLGGKTSRRRPCAKT